MSDCHCEAITTAAARIEGWAIAQMPPPRIRVRCQLGAGSALSTPSSSPATSGEGPNSTHIHGTHVPVEGAVHSIISRLMHCNMIDAMIDATLTRLWSLAGKPWAIR